MGLSAPVRLAILEADTPLPNTNAKFHGYRGVFTDLFRRAVAPEPLESHLAITGYDVVNHPDTYPDLDSIDAVLISGSKHSAYLDEPWILKLVEFTKSALATDGRVKIVGVCFGHQIVGRALGMKVGVNEKGWEISVTEMKLSEKGKALFGSDVLRIHQMHKDMVLATPAGAQELAETDVCANQGFILPGKAITVQGHPEFTGEIVPEILGLRHETGIFDEETYKSGMERVRKEHDGVRIAQAFLKFIRGEIA
ncbi:hypothetical protein N0V93_007694 [Gnomoniopsis smithogilvyi]|uniref:Glutamine amidotransferase domain-containing protein n=1 Tax=Gnomoniopsis smithogilvyi TaxID=1191159 RepID=A0A9W9CU27_9PEZI|nr:hypothetical protein N0V93_007694 [Gnomoniopsis smithogilvyi]